MASNLAFLSFFSLISLHLLHHAFASSRGLYVPKSGGDNASAATAAAGICSIAVTIHGYKCQEFEVTTNDGYILSVQRIPEGRTGGGGTNRPPVLLQHGVLVDAMSWLVNTPEQSLPMILADNGFDVWIPSTRGTWFSRRHVKLDPRSAEYWDWSWDELVSQDLPAVIDLVFKQTGQKVHYLGHSMGTLLALASLSEGTFKNVKSAALLSPIAYLTHMTTPIGIVAARAFVGEITVLFGLAEFNPKGEAVDIFLKALCATPGVDCYDLVAAFTGKNCCLNSSTVHVFLQHEPQPTATKNLVHFAQIARDGVLAKYNYGNAKNKELYGTSNPPLYDLYKIPHDFPLFLAYGGRDALSDARDVSELINILKSHDQDKLQVLYVKDYAHADFIMAVTAKDVIYKDVVAFFRRHN